MYEGGSVYNAGMKRWERVDLSFNHFLGAQVGKIEFQSKSLLESKHQTNCGGDGLDCK